jgi:hypothetical protein
MATLTLHRHRFVQIDVETRELQEQIAKALRYHKITTGVCNAKRLYAYTCDRLMIHYIVHEVLVDKALQPTPLTASDFNSTTDAIEALLPLNKPWALRYHNFQLEEFTNRGWVKSKTITNPRIAEKIRYTVCGGDEPHPPISYSFCYIPLVCIVGFGLYLLLRIF